MFNVCYQCGEFHADKTVEPESAGWAVARCPACGHGHRFRYLPLLIVAGASGAGKSAVLHALTGRLTEAVLLEGDLLWRPEFDRPEVHYGGFFDTWLRLAKNIGQSGRPVVLFNAGAGVPENLARCVERRYFAEVHTLALVCEDAALVARLRARPAWRGCADPAFVAAQQAFNRWFQETGPTLDPPIALVDTTAQSVAETAAQVAAWIRKRTG